MTAGMAVWVHGHETGVLQKPRINTATLARKITGNREDHIFFKPLIRLGGGQCVDCRGGLAGINRAAHHDHRQGRGLATRSHQGDGCKHRHGGLAHADDVAVAIFALQVADEFLDVIDIVVKVERAIGQRYVACVFPVGDVDLVVFQHGLDGVAQQGGVMARQRRYDQYCRLALELGERGRVVRKAFKAAQFAKRLVDFDAFLNRQGDAVSIYRMDVKRWFFIILAQAVHQAVACRHALGKRGFADG